MNTTVIFQANGRKKKHKRFFERYLSYFDGPVISDISINKNDTCRYINANLNLQSYLLKVQNSVLLNPSFLPKPYFFEPAKKDEGTYISLPFAMDVLIECTINFDEPRILYEPKYVDLSAGNITCFYSIDQTSDNQIRLTVGFTCAELDIILDEMDNIRSINDQLSKVYQHGIKIN